MKFRELAWAVYVYEVTADDSAYNELFLRDDLLKRLRQDPKTVVAEELDESVINFLRRWGGRHIPKNDKVAPAFIRTISEVHETLKVLQDESIIAVNLEEHQSQIEGVFSALLKISWRNSAGTEVSLGETFASKLAHVLNPELFVIWGDNKVRKRFYKGDNYYHFLCKIQRSAQAVSKDFQRMGIKGDPACFLSTKMGLEPPKTLAKFLDEYNMRRKSDQNMMPPGWLLSLTIDK